MKKSIINCSITVNNKKYLYVISKIHDESTHIECKAAKVEQECLNEDIPALIFNLPNLILEQENKSNQNEIIRFRVTKSERDMVQQKALEKGYKTISAFLKHLIIMS